MKKKFPEDKFHYKYGEEVTFELQDDGKWRRYPLELTGMQYQ